MPASVSTRQQLSQLMEFELIRNGVYIAQWVFLIPPESYEQEEAVRSNVVRTTAGGYADLFGGDFPQITIEGTTGYNVRRIENGVEVDGYQHWLDFLNTIHRVFIESPLTDSTRSYRLHYFNWTHRQYYSIMPKAVTWDMAVPENTVFYYHIEAEGLEPLLRPRTQPPGAGYDTMVSSGTQYFQQSATDGVTHTAMVLKLLGKA